MRWVLRQLRATLPSIAALTPFVQSTGSIISFEGRTAPGPGTAIRTVSVMDAAMATLTVPVTVWASVIQADSDMASGSVFLTWAWLACFTAATDTVAMAIRT